MLFNSYIFIFVFLPVALLGYFTLGRKVSGQAAIGWLVLASLFFYAWWNPVYIFLILTSILVNYFFGLRLSSSPRKWVLTLGLSFNLGLLGYFKYANFFMDNLNRVVDTGMSLETIVLPLAISFFTFQQISYLVDAYRGQTKEYNFLHYCLFVTFFPQLIAGPIVHHREMLPQFEEEDVYRFNVANFAAGLSIFFAGLFKKAVLADEVAKYVAPVFNAFGAGDAVSTVEAWAGVTAYSFQLYFDFSGYSDMAIGLALLFGIRLPLNFYSPYKASSIIEIWRRWHITLSRFLMEYIYIPLGGSRKGEPRKYLNLVITFLLGGLWHGAGWTYVFWGLINGFYLTINNLWRKFKQRLGISEVVSTAPWRMVPAVVLTFVAWLVSLVVFRSLDMGAAMTMLNTMFVPAAGGGVIKVERAFNLLIPLGVIIWAMPNVRQIMDEFKPTIDTYRGELSGPRLLSWRPVASWAVVAGIVGVLAVLYCNQPSEFLYFQF